MEKLSKEVREKIAKIILDSNQELKHQVGYEIADQILALFPPQQYLGEEEIRKIIVDYSRRSADFFINPEDVNNLAHALSNRLPANQSVDCPYSQDGKCYAPKQEQKYCKCKEPVIVDRENIFCDVCGLPFPPSQEKEIEELEGEDEMRSMGMHAIKINELVVELNLLRKQKERK